VLIKSLGEGNFGTVMLCSNKHQEILYALKTVPRTKIINYSLYKNLQQERELLLMLDSNFIMKLVKTFKDEHRIYFLQEYIAGEDLFDAIRN
jgi:serine/threonine protein kinase